jgi:hypothetical protein
MTEVEVCEECGKSVGYGEGTHVDSSGLLCSACANARLSRHTGIPFDHPDFSPMTLPDAEGRPHDFRFVTRLVPPGVSIEAREAGKRGDGYEFQVLGGHDADTMVLFRALLERMRRELGRRHLERRKGTWRIGRDGVVRARIQYDEDSEEDLPLVVIDGRPLRWDEFGRMLKTYEGWQFKLEIYANSEEIREETIDRTRFLMSRVTGEDVD